jgi:hypothetical protein
VRAAPLLALALVATVACVAPAGAAPVPACRTAEVRVHDEAVFGHFATPGVAQSYLAKARSVGFQGLKIEDDGCGDFEVEIDGADTQRDRSSFAAEAAAAGYQITFEQRGDPLHPPPGQVYGVLGRFRTLGAANAFAWRAAASNYRYIEVVNAGARWLVVMPQVPIKHALPIAQEAAKAGFHIQFTASAP